MVFIDLPGTFCTLVHPVEVEGNSVQAAAEIQLFHCLGSAFIHKSGIYSQALPKRTLATEYEIPWYCTFLH